MKSTISTLSIVAFTLLLSVNLSAQDFQGKAYYFSKTTMDMSRWNRGGQMSEAQKKQMAANMKPWLEKTYVLTFSKEESMFIEDEKLAGPVGGRAPSVWGSSFSAGPQYKNVKTKIFLQDQEFFGKQFLIKEEMKPLDWKMGTETKQIGQYTCFKATASRPSTEVNWTRTNRSRDADKDDKTKKADSTKTGDLAKSEEKPEEEEIEMVEIVAWYTPMVPVNQGPGEYWGLPGLILEVSAGNTTMLCSKIIMNPEEKTKIEAPTKGQVVTKKEYNEIITGKMQEMRDNRGRGSERSGR
ncbi:MAG: GLPGLI family protein [Patescibacteria group bacterium]|jgi:GLPGLI family protein